MPGLSCTYIPVYIQPYRPGVVLGQPVNNLTGKSNNRIYRNTSHDKFITRADVGQCIVWSSCSDCRASLVLEEMDTILSEAILEILTVKAGCKPSGRIP